MLHIEIHIPRPLQTLSLLAALGVGYVMGAGRHIPFLEDAMGGTGQVQAEVVAQAEQDVRRLREEQDVLSRRESIMRAELETLQQELDRTKDPYLLYDLSKARDNLIALIQDQKKAEQEILASLHQIWEAQGYALHISGNGNGTISLLWPVEPELGISAHFEDDAYERRFGIPHHAVDIPVAQGTVVRSAADGVVAKVSDNGYGFNSVIIKHSNGFATLYGHVSGFLVQEGQQVRAGDPIALSGGRPGTKGAGRMTTGAHLHLELIKDGEHVDPLPYLRQ